MIPAANDAIMEIAGRVRIRLDPGCLCADRNTMTRERVLTRGNHATTEDMGAACHRAARGSGSCDGRGVEHGDGCRRAVGEYPRRHCQGHHPRLHLVRDRGRGVGERGLRQRLQSSHRRGERQGRGERPQDQARGHRRPVGKQPQQRQGPRPESQRVHRDQRLAIRLLELPVPERRRCADARWRLRRLLLLREGEREHHLRVRRRHPRGGHHVRQRDQRDEEARRQERRRGRVRNIPVVERGRQGDRERTRRRPRVSRADTSTPRSTSAPPTWHPSCSA